jgi:hypothetical protein
MRELRHPKLVEFVGVCLAQPNICIVTGKLRAALFIHADQNITTHETTLTFSFISYY